MNVINLLAIAGCLNWIALRARPDIAWGISRAASLITHGRDTCLIKSSTFANIYTILWDMHCDVFHLSPQTKHKLWVLGDVSFALTGEKSQQGLIVYSGITSNQRNSGNLVQWRSSRQDLIAKLVIMSTFLISHLLTENLDIACT